MFALPSDFIRKFDLVDVEASDEEQDDETEFPAGGDLVARGDRLVRHLLAGGLSARGLEGNRECQGGGHYLRISSSLKIY